MYLHAVDKVKAADPDVICEGVQPPRFQRANELFEFLDRSQLSLSGDECGYFVKAHKQDQNNIPNSIEDNLVNGMTLPEYITKLNLNIANASMEYVYYRNDDGT